MSFGDTKYVIELYTIVPWRAFRQKSVDLNQIHNESVNQFAQVMVDLLTGSDGEPAFQGPAADALARMVGDFLAGENKLSGSSTDPSAQVGLLPDLASACEKWASQLEQKLNDIASQPVYVTNPVLESTAALNAGAVTQLGADIPWDVFALLLTAVVAIFVLGVIDTSHGFRVKSPDEVEEGARDQAADQAENDDINSFNNDATGVQNNNPFPKIPNDPQTDPRAFLKLMGIGAGVAALLAAGATIIWNLTPDQQRLRDDIKRTLTREGVPFDDSDLEDLIMSGYSEEEIRAIIASIIRLYKNGTIDKVCIQKILRSFNKAEPKNVLPFSQAWQLRAHAGAHDGDFGLNSLTPADDLRYQQLAIDFMKGTPGPNVLQL
ncbi:MAG: hypothetical protein ACRDHW_09675, partial [Ktedonobacteraceae bacterium]